MRATCFAVLLLAGMAVAGERPRSAAPVDSALGTPPVQLNEQMPLRRFVLPPGVLGPPSACLVLDTYRVRRETRKSDATRMIGRTHCTDAAKFRLRPASPVEGARPKDQ